MAVTPPLQVSAWTREQARLAADRAGYVPIPPHQQRPSTTREPYPPTMRHVGRVVCSGRENLGE